MARKRSWADSVARLVASLLPVLAASCDQHVDGLAAIDSGEIELVAGEREALRTLLQSTGLTDDQFSVRGAVGAANSAIIIDAHVHTMELSDVSLADLSPLAEFTALQRLRFTGGALRSLDGLPQACKLRTLYVASAGLARSDGIASCAELRDLSLPNNALTELPPLQTLPMLQNLDLAGNAIATAGSIVGLPALESLSLADNGLGQCPLIESLPALRRLLLSRNELTDLNGLRDLPALTQLLVDDNRLVDASAVDQFAQLEVLNLNGNHLQQFPLRVAELDPLHWSDNPGYLTKIRADHDERRARLTERGLAEALPASDSSQASWSEGYCQWQGSSPSCRLSFDELSGTRRVYLARWASDPLRSDPRRRGVSGVVARLSVAQGTARVYLNRQAVAERLAEAAPTPQVRIGYPYAEASTDDPKAMAGQLFVDGSGVWLLLEAVGGSAAEVTIQIEPGYVH